MGNIAVMRATWRARSNIASGTDERDGGEMPPRDLALDTLREVLAGEILVHNHCYRADEMAIMLDMAQGVRLQGRQPSTMPSRATRSPIC